MLVISRDSPLFYWDSKLKDCGASSIGWKVKGQILVLLRLHILPKKGGTMGKNGRNISTLKQS
jgi:hypothetical protein